MEFRWISLIALWTLLTGPIFQSSAPTRRAERHPVAVVKTAVPPAPDNPESQE